MQRPAATIALVPFGNLTDSQEEGRLAAGFVYDLAAELAGFPWLGVIAPSAVAAENDALAPGEIALRLGVQYLLRGSLRRWGESVRISVQLVEADNGQQVWTGRYDGPGLAEIHDEIAAKVANALASKLNQSILAATRRQASANVDAYTLWLLGLESLYRGSAEADEAARGFFQKALALDPGYARAHGGLSLSYFNEWSCQAWEQWEIKERHAYEHAVRAEALDPNDATVQLILGKIEQYRRHFDRATPRLDRARLLAANDSNILIQLASCYSFEGNSQLGCELAARALELNPLAPSWFYCYAVISPFSLRRYEETLGFAAKAAPGQIVDLPAYQAAAWAYLGDVEKAAGCLAEFREEFRTRIACGRETSDSELLRWTLHVNPYRKDEDSKHLEEGLRLAGLEGEASLPAPILPWPIANTFRKEGKNWTLAFQRQVAQLPELRGFIDLARLMAQPGEEIHCAKLAGQATRSAGVEVLDEKALRAYKVRLNEIEEELQTAIEGEDDERAVRLEGEREVLVAEIKRATGLGGRIRKKGDTDERCRTAVTWRIRHAIAKIGEAHEPLGRHLANSVRTGSFCSYQPESTVVWSL